ncbi:MAG TPA: DUF4129 domain-containing protein [Pyrinomonadaceae bacterium]|jgi:hypothetical protein
MLPFARTLSARRLLLALVLLGGAGGLARAVPLAEYRARVAQADKALASLMELYAAGADGGDAPGTPRFRREEAARLAALRAALPAEAQVEWPGGALRADNRWLAESLAEFEQLPPDNAAERAAALERADVRLHALYERLDEAERARPAEAPRDKSAEKGRLHALLQRPEFNQEQAAQESALQRLWQRILRWLRNLMPERRPMQPGTATSLSRAARGFVYGLSVAVIVFALWRYGPRLLRRKLVRPRKQPKARVILGEQLAPEQTPAGLLAEAEGLARAGDLRGAMRKAYIAVLYELGERKLLRLAPHKTNRDYLRALRDHARAFQFVQPLTVAYERHWYGLVPADPADWSAFQQQCEKAVTSDE